MKYLYTNISGALLMIAMLVSSPSTLALPPSKTAGEPQVVVEQVTHELFGLVRAKNADKTSNDVYFQQVEKVLDGVVNFEFIAGAVMGKEAYAKASATQRKKFIKVFKRGLVKSYAKGITGYADSEIKLIGVIKDKKNPNRVVVKQEVSDEGVAHKLDYTMVRSKTGEWKLINVVLNGVNLGQSFSGQFKAALQKYNGDVDQVITNWLSEA